MRVDRNERNMIIRPVVITTDKIGLILLKLNLMLYLLFSYQFRFFLTNSQHHLIPMFEKKIQINKIAIN